MVNKITSNQDFYSAIKSDKLTVVDAFAEWCGPCKMISPVLEKYSQEFTNANFIKIDVDELSELAQELGITAMPTFLFFKNGEKIETIIGANPTKLKATIAANA